MQSCYNLSRRQYNTHEFGLKRHRNNDRLDHLGFYLATNLRNIRINIFKK